MLRPHLLLILVLLLLQPGCKSGPTGPVRFPGFESSPSETLAIIRESHEVFLRSVDGRRLKRHLFDGLGVGERDFQIPAGLHLITVYATGTDQSDGSLYEVGDFNMHVTLQPGHTYLLGNWHQVVFDDTTQQPVPTTAPATNPRP